MKALIIILALAALACTLQIPPQKQADLLTIVDKLPAVPTVSPTVIQRITVNITPTPTPSPICKVTAAALNVRSCPSASCSALAWLSEGDIITITHPITSWAKMPAGWINVKFLECVP